MGNMPDDPLHGDLTESACAENPEAGGVYWDVPLILVIVHGIC